jgi:mannose-1-phosphate guanylyltransferase
MRIGGKHSLIQQSILRAAAATPDGPIVIVTHADHVEPIATHVAQLASSGEAGTGDLATRIVYLSEPVGRNTAPAIAYGMHYLRSHLGDTAIALVLTADHVIEPVDVFAKDASKASELAGQGRLVCFGIEPRGPETGFGYIHVGRDLGPGREVRGFTEKPDLQTAERYVESGDYLWNSGMFCYAVGTFWGELSTHAPDVAVPFGDHGMIELRERDDHARSADPDSLRTLYDALPSISIDYALMERSEHVAAVPAAFGWNDVGSWDEIATLATGSRDAGQPVVIQVQAESNHVDSDLPVAICDLSDILVVVRNGKVLVCRRGSSQLVKQVVESARTEGRDELL